MKLLIINTLYYPNHIGGADLSIKVLAEELVQRGIDVHVASLTNDHQYKSDEHNGVKCHYFPLRNISWPFDGYSMNSSHRALWHFIDTYSATPSRELADFVGRLRPDIVHTNSVVGFGCQIWWHIHRQCPRILHTLRDYYLLHPNSTLYKDEKHYDYKNTLAKVLSLPRRKATRLVRAVVGNSEFTLNRHLQEGLFPEALECLVIYNGYPCQDNIAKEKTSDRSLTFGFIGRISPDKGLELLIREFPLANDFRLIIAGTGLQDYTANLQKQIHATNVEFVGFQPTASFMNQIDALIVPSLWHDPLPRVIFEAYSHGLPVIASSRGGIPEIIKPERTGLIFNPSQTGDLSKSIHRFLELLKQGINFSEECLDYANHFRPSRVADDYLSVYNKIL